MKILKWLFISASALFIIYLIIIAKKSNSFDQDEQEPLKSYFYSVSKYELEKAVFTILQTNKNIHHTRSDSADHYNDGINYITLKIKHTNPHLECEYITSYKSHKYNGDDTHSSELSIPHVHVSNNKDFRKDGNLRSELIDSIERELINKVDSILDGKRM